jgi:hypothetical protein
MVKTDFEIRVATTCDAPDCGPPTAELGYAASSTETVARLDRVLEGDS